MDKDWEKEFYHELIYPWQRLLDMAKEPISVHDAPAYNRVTEVIRELNKAKAFIAKQRTQVLKKVKEVLIYSNRCNWCKDNADTFKNLYKKGD